MNCNMNIVNFFTENFWATCAVLSSVTVTCAGYINAKLNTNNVWKQVVAWAVSIILTICTYFTGIIELSEPTWISIPLTGVIVGLSSNGIYDIPKIKEIINNLNKNVSVLEFRKK